MNTKRLVCLATAAALGLGSVSVFAQGYDRRDNNDRHDSERWDHQRYDQRSMGNRDQDRDHGRHDDRNHARHDDRDHGRPDVYYSGARGPEWHRGGRMPEQYRSHQYVVDDWHSHHLSAPPRGYHWVQVGNDYVLAAIATGIIAQLLLNNS